MSGRVVMVVVMATGTVQNLGTQSQLLTILFHLHNHTIPHSLFHLHNHTQYLTICSTFTTTHSTSLTLPPAQPHTTAHSLSHLHNHIQHLTHSSTCNTTHNTSLSAPPSPPHTIPHYLLHLHHHTQYIPHSLFHLHNHTHNTSLIAPPSQPHSIYCITHLYRSTCTFTSEVANQRD